MITIFSVVGTRPEAIKMAPVIKELQTHRQIKSIVCSTAQHREMLDQVLDLFHIRPTIDLDLMRANQSLNQITSNILTAMENAFTEYQPDWVLVQGDTTTVMATALAAYYHRIKVGHVEAGLRTHNKFEPFPEEINRRITDVIADLYLAPTKAAQENLLLENIDASRIHVTGNTVIDALFQVLKQPYDLKERLPQIPWEKKIILLTAHRRENFGQPLESIFKAVVLLCEKYKDLHFIYPVHPNPNVKNKAASTFDQNSSVTLCEPLDYISLVHVMQSSYLVLTDSGGLQEEAPSLGKPVLVLRNTTERPEAVEAGTAKLVGWNHDKIVEEVERLLQDETSYQRMASAKNPYGDGKAAERIVKTLLESDLP